MSASLAPRPGSYEATAGYALAAAVAGVVFLAWWWPMAALYGVAAVVLARFAQRRIRAYGLTGERLASVGDTIGITVVAFTLLGTAMRTVLGA